MSTDPNPVSRYRLQIVLADDPERRVVQGWQPGDRVEADLVEELCRRVSRKRVGVFSGRGRVVEMVREAAGELLYELKGRV